MLVWWRERERRASCRRLRLIYTYIYLLLGTFLIPALQKMIQTLNSEIKYCYKNAASLVIPSLSILWSSSSLFSVLFSSWHLVALNSHVLLISTQGSFLADIWSLAIVELHRLFSGHWVKHVQWTASRFLPFFCLKSPWGPFSSAAFYRCRKQIFANAKYAATCGSGFCLHMAKPVRFPPSAILSVTT